MSPVPPLREQLRASRACRLAELLRPRDALPAILCLLRPTDSAGYVWATPSTRLEAGDEVVVYRVGAGQHGRLEQANLLFAERFYARASSGVAAEAWPDEQALITGQLPPRGARMLEICCGGGRVSTHLPRAGNQVCGLDISQACIEAAQAAARPGVRYLLGDARSLPFPDASFDIALCLENSLGVFFVDRLMVIKELLRCCRPGGEVILGLRQAANPRQPMQIYASADGYLEFAQCFPRARALRMLRGLRSAQRLGEVRFLEPEGPRPWGGRVYYLQLGRV